MPFLIFIVAVLVVCGLLFVMWKMQKKRLLRGKDLAVIVRAWENMLKLQDPARRVMEADKILDAALTALGYTGSLGEKLKKAGPRFSQLQALWSAHKLRNTLAHEMHAMVSAGDADRAITALRQALCDLGMH